MWRREHSLWLFHPEARLRVLCTRAAKHRMFEQVILFSIALSCILLTMDNPHAEQQVRHTRDAKKLRIEPLGVHSGGRGAHAAVS